MLEASTANTSGYWSPYEISFELEFELELDSALAPPCCFVAVDRFGGSAQPEWSIKDIAHMHSNIRFIFWFPFVVIGSRSD